jgi:hypothetical protein
MSLWMVSATFFVKYVMHYPMATFKNSWELLDTQWTYNSFRDKNRFSENLAFKGKIIKSEIWSKSYKCKHISKLKFLKLCSAFPWSSSPILTPPGHISPTLRTDCPEGCISWSGKARNRRQSSSKISWLTTELANLYYRISCNKAIAEFFSQHCPCYNNGVVLRNYPKFPVRINYFILIQGLLFSWVVLNFPEL